MTEVTEYEALNSSDVKVEMVKKGVYGFIQNVSLNVFDNM